MIINGSDLFMWISTELVAYSTSYSLNIEMETRPGTNKGSGIYRKALPGMLNISGSVDGLYVFAGGYATLFGRMVDRTPVRLRFGRKDSVTGQVDTTVDFMSADFLITSLELNATDAENATYTASFVYYDGFGSVSGITVPTVITDFASLPTTTTIKMNGNVTSDGGAIVTDRGFVWNTDGNPTMADFHISEGSGTGVYSQLVTGLASGTPYFFRAYATNAAGTSYGFASTFTTVAEAVPSYFWIAPNGSDTTGDGEFNTPWLTLAYAITQVTTGDTINMKVGTYSLATQVVLPVGISIKGQGDSTLIRTTAALSPMIYLSSASEGTDGNQSISYLKVDGELTATSLIYVSGRSNADIHHCTFVDALTYGVTFRGRVDNVGAEPTTYATGNKFRNNTMTNCGSYVSDGRAGLEYSGQDGLLIQDNTISQPDRGTGYHGHCIKSVINYGYSKGVKIYDNTLTVPDYEGNGFEFAIETWNQWGIEISNNVITGAIDLGGHFSGLKGAYAYGASVHDNIIGFNALLPEGVAGIYLEGDSEEIHIYRNYIKNVGTGIYINPVGSASDLAVLGRQYHTYDDIYVYYNIFDNIGENALGSSSKGWGVRLLGGDFNHLLDNMQVLNNVMIGDTDATSTHSGLFIHAFGTVTNFVFRNNILRNFDYAPTYMAHGTTIALVVDYLSIENNIFYTNGNSNVPRYGAGMTPTNNTTQNNITSDPLFVSTSNFHLQEGSPCINAGLATGLAFITTDYDEVAVDDPPEIGAYEFV